MSIGRMTGKEMERKQFKNVKLSISWLPCKILNIITNCYCKWSLISVVWFLKSNKKLSILIVT